LQDSNSQHSVSEHACVAVEDEDMMWAATVKQGAAVMLYMQVYVAHKQYTGSTGLQHVFVDS
jgi:hypothetical protein